MYVIAYTKEEIIIFTMEDTTKTRELVIAAYDKELSWLKGVNPNIKITVYRKGDVLSLSDNEVRLEPNLGRCVHTFFTHIYNNYDNLADYTFFAQDFPFDHWGNLLEILNGPDYAIADKATLLFEEYYGYHNNTLGTAWQMPQSVQLGRGHALMCNSNGYPQDHNPNINVDKYWHILFELPDAPPVYEFIPGGHFAITKEQLRKNTKEQYKKIIELLENDVTAPWMIERLEGYIFNTKFKLK